ncbi:MAG: hypothetical protein KAI43_08490 [Candidatus Aureabacteria bacterium]|nr:hypothetical protein [Candidatus Auribacterota bacterium]
MTEEIEKDFSLEIKKLNRKRTLGLGFFGLMLLAIIVVAVVTEIKNIRFNPLLIMPFVMSGVFVATYSISSKCPKCGKHFYGIPIRAFYASSCYHCKCGGNN